MAHTKWLIVLTFQLHRLQLVIWKRINFLATGKIPSVLRLYTMRLAFAKFSVFSQVTHSIVRWL